MIGGDEVVERLPALAGREPTVGLSLLRLPDRRQPPRADRAGRGRALRRGVRQPAGGHRPARRGGRTRGVCVRDALSGDRFELRADNVVNATGVWADRLRPDELHDEAEVPRIRRRAAATSPSPMRRSRWRPGRSSPPATGARSSRCRGWARPSIGTTDNDYDARISTTSGPPRTTSPTSWMRSTRSSGPRWRRADITGAFAGVRPLIATADPRSPSTSRARPSSSRPPAA